MENNRLIISQEARAIKIFKALIARDKHVDKVTAVAELMFIYCMGDYKSSYTNYAEAERQIRIIKDIMPTGWKPDELVRECLDFYIEHQKTPSLKALTESKESLLSSTSLLSVLRRMLNSQIDKLNLALSIDEEVDEGIKLQALENIDSVYKLTKNIPTLITTLEALEEKVKKEQTSNVRVRGGGELNKREM